MGGRYGQAQLRLTKQSAECEVTGATAAVSAPPKMQRSVQRRAANLLQPSSHCFAAAYCNNLVPAARTPCMQAFVNIGLALADRNQLAQRWNASVAQLPEWPCPSLTTISQRISEPQLANLTLHAAMLLSASEHCRAQQLDRCHPFTN